VSETPDLREYLPLFLDEAEEQVAALDEGLLRLEREPDSPSPLEEVFRAAHSLKSAAAAMGFVNMSRLCHAAEGLLERFRSGAARPEPGLMTLLLRAADAVKTMHQRIAAGGSDDVEAADLVAGLERAAAEVPRPSASETLGVKVRLRADCEMPSVRAQVVLAAVEAVADIVGASPPREEIEAGRFTREFTLLVSTGAGEDAVRWALEGVSEVEGVEVAPADKPQGEVACDDRAAGRQAVERERPPGPPSARAGGQTVRVNVARLERLMNLVGELVTERNRVARIGLALGGEQPAGELVRELKEAGQHMARVVGELQEEVMRTRMLPVAQLFRRFPRPVRDLSAELGKEVDLSFVGEETELDRSVIEEMVDPLGHLLRNAIDHGVEPPEVRERAGKPRRATITLAARQEEDQVVIEVRDDGAGMDLEKLKALALRRGVISAGAAAALSPEKTAQLVFASGLSTAERVTDISGRGVGMDVVKAHVARLRGSVHIRTARGAGTTVTMRLPLTLAISQALLVRAGQTTVAIPLAYVIETARLGPASVQAVHGRLAATLRGRALPLVGLREVVGEPGPAPARPGSPVDVVRVRSGGHEFGFIVDELVGDQEVVIKPVGPALGEVPGVLGATILGDGAVALVLDVASLLERKGLRAAPRAVPAARPASCAAGAG